MKVTVFYWFVLLATFVSYQFATLVDVAFFNVGIPFATVWDSVGENLSLIFVFGLLSRSRCLF